MEQQEISKLYYLQRISLIFVFYTVFVGVSMAESAGLNLVGLVTCFHDGNRQQESPAKHIIAIPYQYSTNMAVSDQFGSYVIKDIPKTLIDQNIYIHYRDAKKPLTSKFFFLGLENLEEYRDTLRVRLPRTLITMDCAKLENDAVEVHAYREGYLRHAANKSSARKAMDYWPMFLAPIPIIGGMDLIEKNQAGGCVGICNVIAGPYNNGLVEHDLRRLFVFSNNNGFNLTSSRSPARAFASRNLYHRLYAAYQHTKVDLGKRYGGETESALGSTLLKFGNWSFTPRYFSITENGNESERYAFTVARQFQLLQLGVTFTKLKLFWKSGYQLLGESRKEEAKELDVFFSVYPSRSTQVTLTAMNLNNTKLGDQDIASRYLGAGVKYTLSRVHLGLEFFQRADDAKLHVGMGLDYKPPIPKTRIQFGVSSYESSTSLSLEYHGINISYNYNAVLDSYFSFGVNWGLF